MFVVGNYAASTQLVAFALSHARRHDFKFLSCKVYTDDFTSIHGLQKNGFLLQDTMLDFTFDFSINHQARELPRVNDLIVRSARSSDADKLEELFSIAFKNHFGRFNTDQNISIDQALSVYRSWGRAGATGTFIDVAKVAEHSTGDLIGATLWKYPTQSEKTFPIIPGYYSIGAVHPSFSGLGVFKILTSAGLGALKDEGVNLVLGPTHAGNLPVQQAYIKAGWAISGARHTFHIWP
jgi:GNAT superfamily N-acetyltransferase